MPDMIEVKCARCGQPAFQCTQRVVNEARKRGLLPSCDNCCDEDKMSDSFQDEFEHEIEGLE